MNPQTSVTNPRKLKKEINYGDLAGKHLMDMHSRLVLLKESIHKPTPPEERKKRALDLQKSFMYLKASAVKIKGINQCEEDQDLLMEDLKRRLELKRDLLERLNEIPKKLKQVNPGSENTIGDRNTSVLEEEDLPPAEGNYHLKEGLNFKKEDLLNKLKQNTLNEPADKINHQSNLKELLANIPK
uniref:Coiled-coil domain-containing protein 149 n=1 Tax=Parastrongyloides trichosuri TaxID=131310 RepID=A0A0N4ZK63_PARTI